MAQICRICDRRGEWPGGGRECPECQRITKTVNFCRDCGRPSPEIRCADCRTITPAGPVEIIPPSRPGQPRSSGRDAMQELPGRPESELPAQQHRGGSYRDLLREGDSGRIAPSRAQPPAVPAPQPPPSVPAPVPPNTAGQYVEVHHHHYPESPVHSGPPEQMPCGICNKMPTQHSNTLHCSNCNKLYGWHTIRQLHFHCLGCGNKLW